MIDMYILDEDYSPIHLHQNENIRLLSCKSSIKLNEIRSLSIGFPRGNERASWIFPRTSKVEIRNHTTRDLLFRGRVMDYTMSSTISYTVEGSESFLKDTIQKKIEDFVGKPSELLELLLTEHNKQATDETKFVVGEVGMDVYKYYPSSGEITETNAGPSVGGSDLAKGQVITVKPNAKYIYSTPGGTRLNMAGYFKGTQATINSITTLNGVKWYRLYTGSTPQGYVLAEEIKEAVIVQNDSKGDGTPGYNASYVEKERTITCNVEEGAVTWDVIKDNLLEYGEFYVDYEPDGTNRLNVPEKIGVEVDTPIREALNTLDFSETYNVSDLITRIRAVGRPIVVEGEPAPGEEDYIYLSEDILINTSLEQMYDPKTVRMEFNDVENENDLRHKAASEFEKQMYGIIESEITFMDLQKLGMPFDSLNLGDTAFVDIVSSRYTKGLLRIIRVDIDYLMPWKSTLTIGRESPRLADFFR